LSVENISLDNNLFILNLNFNIKLKIIFMGNNNISSESLKSTIDYIRNEIYKLDNVESISLIEKDIILDKIKYLYELVYYLEVNQSNKLHITSSSEVESRNIEEVLDKNIDNNLKEDKIPFIPQVENEEKDKKVEREKIKFQQFENDKTTDKKEVVSDTSRVSLNDKLRVFNEKETIADKINKQLLKDLKKAIGINEKFLFINNLFKGNSEDYQLAIDFLNNIESYSDAENYINTLSLKYNWDKTTDAYNEFMNLISKKFGV